MRPSRLSTHTQQLSQWELKTQLPSRFALVQRSTQTQRQQSQRQRLLRTAVSCSAASPWFWFDPAQITTSNTQQKFGQPRSTSADSGRVGYIRCLGCGHNCRVMVKSTCLFVLAVAVLHCIATRFARSPSNLPQSGARNTAPKRRAK